MSEQSTRFNNRHNKELRPIKFTKDFQMMKASGKSFLIRKKPSLMKLLGNVCRSFAKTDVEILQRAEKVFFPAWYIVPIVVQSYISVLQRA